LILIKECAVVFLEEGVMDYWFSADQNFKKRYPSIWKVVRPTLRSIDISFESQIGKVYYDYLCTELAEYEFFRRQQEEQSTKPEEPNYWLLTSDAYEAMEELSPENERRIPPYVRSVRKIPVWWRIRRLFDVNYRKALLHDWRHQFLWQEQLAKEEQRRRLAEQKRLEDAAREKQRAVMQERIDLLKEAIRNRTSVYHLRN
jgi:hypothetical protein